METTTQTPLVALHNVTVRFGQQTVLDGLTFEILPKQTVAIVGESGCGKSVTLKLIVGLLAATQGEVRFDGQNLAEMNPADLNGLRRRVGFLFQGAALFDSLNVYENVAFGLRSKGGMSESEIETIVNERLTEVGLSSGTKPKMPAELSGGMRKRVGLARALALNPDVMLYDEPTTGLDPIMTDVINELIMTVRSQRPVTSLVVTHEMKTVFKVAERVIMLQPHLQRQNGEPQILFDGTPEQMQDATDPRVRQFLAGVAGDRVKTG